MRLLIAGGRLQAAEAVYLAKKAGWTTIVADRRENAEASLMCDEFHCVEIENEAATLPLVEKADAVLPALENLSAVSRLEEYCRKSGKPFLFDLNAYLLSSSKLKSDDFFRENDIPAPLHYPKAGFPLIAKPDGQSGSVGVRLILNQEELNKVDSGWVIQEYLSGRSYSLEVVGDGKSFNLLQVTEIITDKDYDCECVIAGGDIPACVEREFYAIGARLGELIRVNGVFDIEVIASGGGLRVIEIDARLPSQTPISVYHSSGVNILELMLNYRDFAAKIQRKKTAIYRQIHVSEKGIVSKGERILTGRGPLLIKDGLFGAESMITDYAPDKKEWVAAVIVTGKSQSDAEEKFRVCVDNIRGNFTERAFSCQGSNPRKSPI
ncbi:MAG: 3-methylornithine--L-lysine ligase PylC [Oscillospiraceae bacterium]|jgi:pyrrolysine biosynthesis protein PylC|nr:3-methylornithine--L-lysine ligase PylC [Oscillospiraceae bacterium]